MVWIFIDHGIVAVPVPSIDEANVIWSDAEIKSVEPESTRAATGQMPDMIVAKATGEVSVLPRVVQVVVRIVQATVVAYPPIEQILQSPGDNRADQSCGLSFAP